MVEQQHRPWNNAEILKILDNDGWKSSTGTSHQGFGNSNHFRERDSFQLLAVSEVVIFIIGHSGLLKLDQS